MKPAQVHYFRLDLPVLNFLWVFGSARNDIRSALDFRSGPALVNHRSFIANNFPFDTFVPVQVLNAVRVDRWRVSIVEEFGDDWRHWFKNCLKVLQVRTKTIHFSLLTHHCQLHEAFTLAWIFEVQAFMAHRLEAEHTEGVFMTMGHAN